MWGHPLRLASTFLYEVANGFEAIAVAIKTVPILGEYLSIPFFWITYFFNEVAYYLDLADGWVSALDVDRFIENFIDWIMEMAGITWWEKIIYQGHFVAWVMSRLGFSMIESFMFEAYPEGFIIWKITSWFPDLGFIWDDPFGWIKEKIIEWVPALEYLFEDPVRWVLYMLGVPWGDTITWRYHLFGYLLYASGESRLDSLWWDRYPKYWVRAKVLERWDFLDDLLLDPVGWFWKEFTEAVDRYIDVNIDWLIRTVGRVLNTIWQTRV